MHWHQDSGRLRVHFYGRCHLHLEAGGTRYRAVAIHKDQAGREQHEAMGFHEGWSQCQISLSPGQNQ